ncbi:MAG: hypothetical protein KC455_10590 [Carnobacterium sp.]|nr:hypothetical protein [Carnobacterium sp.]
MIKNLKLFCLSIGTLLLIYLITIFTNFDFLKIINSLSVALTVLAIILSGAAVSGDRQRGNYYANPKETTNSVLRSSKILIFAFPFYLTLLFKYLF